MEYRPSHSGELEFFKYAISLIEHSGSRRSDVKFCPYKKIFHTIIRLASKQLSGLVVSYSTKRKSNYNQRGQSHFWS